jgi:hypothetical protein
MALRTHNQPSWYLKERLWWSSRKRCFEVSKGRTNSFCAFWAPNKAIWVNSLLWCFK